MSLNFSRILSCFVLASLFILGGPYTTYAKPGLPERDVVIIGGGFAGLASLDQFHKLGINNVELHEARHETGGRVSTYSNAYNLGLTVNAGAELVDEGHTELIDLAHEYGLTVSRRFNSGEKPSPFYNFNGEIMTHQEYMQKVFSENELALRRIFGDQEALGKDVDKTVVSRKGQMPESTVAIDQMSALDFLQSKLANQNLIDFYEASLYSETGRHLSEVTALMLFENWSIDYARKSINFLPHNDESLYILGGSQKLSDAIAKKFSSQIQKNSRLTKVKEMDDGRFLLTFTNAKGKTKQVITKKIVMSAPLHEALEIDWQTKKMPEFLKATDIQYSINSKIVVFLNKKFLGAQVVIGHDKESDISYQLWDNSLGQEGEASSLTIYTGSLSGKQTSVSAMVLRTLQSLESKYPGISQAYVGFETHEWPRSYSGSDSPGYRSTHQLKPASNDKRIYVVGEATSAKSPGYMNGAVETGQQASREIAYDLQGPAPVGLMCRQVLMQ